MPGERSPSLRPPAGWGEALSALPMEAPSTSGWPRVAAALDARVRSRWPLWLATAAALALVVLVPLQWARQEEQVDARPVAASDTPSQESRTPAIDTKPVTAPSGHRRARGGGNPAAAATVASRPATSPSMDDPPVAVGVPSRPPGNEDRRQPGRIAIASTIRGRALAPRSGQPRTRSRGDGVAADAASTSPAVVAIGDYASPAQGNETSPAATTTSGSMPSELDRLYAESAQLEALVALARDDRMSTGAVAALGGELQAQLARIDAALVEPSLAPGQRLGLWRDRVQALRQLAGFETTQRLLAARGEQYDGMLVSVD